MIVVKYFQIVQIYKNNHQGTLLPKPTTMKLENQVCTLQQAKRLKELGITQDSFFYHIEAFNDIAYMNKICQIKGFDNSTYSGQYIYSAYTTSEIGVMLPRKYVSEKTQWEDISKKYICGVPYPDGEDNYDYSNNSQFGATEAEARAAMLIYLLENNLTTASEVNERLKNA